jgi:predicted RNA-binding protein Jag
MKKNDIIEAGSIQSHDFFTDILDYENNVNKKCDEEIKEMINELLQNVGLSKWKIHFNLETKQIKMELLAFFKESQVIDITSGAHKQMSLVNVSNEFESFLASGITPVEKMLMDEYLRIFKNRKKDSYVVEDGKAIKNFGSVRIDE